MVIDSNTNDVFLQYCLPLGDFVTSSDGSKSCTCYSSCPTPAMLLKQQLNVRQNLEAAASAQPTTCEWKDNEIQRMLIVFPSHCIFYSLFLAPSLAPSLLRSLPPSLPFPSSCLGPLLGLVHGRRALRSWRCAPRYVQPHRAAARAAGRGRRPARLVRQCRQPAGGCG